MLFFRLMDAAAAVEARARLATRKETIGKFILVYSSVVLVAAAAAIVVLTREER